VPSGFGLVLASEIEAFFAPVAREKWIGLFYRGESYTMSTFRQSIANQFLLRRGRGGPSLHPRTYFFFSTSKRWSQTITVSLRWFTTSQCSTTIP
jgi:hypothetical protein